MNCSKNIIREHFNYMNPNHSYTYKSFTLTLNDKADYYVIIGYTNEYFEEKKTIIFQMEPWVYDSNKLWGIKTWGKWTYPDINKFLHVRKHKEYLNPAQWFFKIPKHINMTDRKDKIIAILSCKRNDIGHINRINLIKYFEELELDVFDVYGYENYHNLKSYKGTINDKSIIQNYKYMLSSENNNEYNYATEKIWEPIVLHTLCFYDGCPNLSDYIDKRAYVPINAFKKDLSVKVIMGCINYNAWEKQVKYIIHEKEKITNHYNALEIIHNFISLK